MVTLSVNGIYTISYTDVVKGTISIPKDAIVTGEVDITLIGKSSLNYGQFLDENVLHLLEHFACPDLNPSSPIGKPDISNAVNPVLQNPKEGQFWFNKSNGHLYVLDSTSNWNPLKMPGDIAANSGIIVHGQQIPLPAGMTSYNQCSYAVSPQYVDQESNYVVCYADATGTVFMKYRSDNSQLLIEGLANYIILGNISTNENHYAPIVSVTPTLTPAPFSTNTPTLTPTPTATPVAGVTVTPTATITPSPTPSTTPTFTVTPTMTRTVTPSPTVTVTPSPIVSNTYTLFAQSFVYSTGLNYISCGYTNLLPETGDAFGSITPTTYKQYSLVGLESYSQNNLAPQVGFYLQNNSAVLAPKNVFSQIVFTDKFGILRTFTSASAQYNGSVNGSIGFTTWVWSNQPAILFNANSTYIITVYF